MNPSHHIGDPSPATFVLVPGGWHGGWDFRPVTDRLRARGQPVYELTLSGVGERSHIPAGLVNLDTHIEDVIRVLEQEDLHDVVLCGHSYGGMVIAGVADRARERIDRLVYIDAYVPDDGDSCFSLTSPRYRQLFLDGARRDGSAVDPPAGLDPRTTSHPIATFLQAISLSGRQHDVRRRDYVYLSGWSGTPFTNVYARLRHDDRWHVYELATGHNAMREAPDELAAILLDGVAAPGPPGASDRPHDAASASCASARTSRRSRTCVRGHG
ncbi:MAG TPA: alpha/beta hydrolase [Solirubrobacteraceae bacterium]|nr:alpha/beta hydrolase [Solirubrobacteraceae bacterium]